MAAARSDTILGMELGTLRHESLGEGRTAIEPVLPRDRRGLQPLGCRSPFIRALFRTLRAAVGPPQVGRRMWGSVTSPRCRDVPPPCSFRSGCHRGSRRLQRPGPDRDPRPREVRERPAPLSDLPRQNARSSCTFLCAASRAAIRPAPGRPSASPSPPSLSPSPVGATPSAISGLPTAARPANVCRGAAAFLRAPTRCCASCGRTRASECRPSRLGSGASTRWLGATDGASARSSLTWKRTPFSIECRTALPRRRLPG